MAVYMAVTSEMVTSEWGTMYSDSAWKYAMLPAIVVSMRPSGSTCAAAETCVTSATPICSSTTAASDHAAMVPMPDSSPLGPRHCQRQ